MRRSSRHELASRPAAWYLWWVVFRPVPKPEDAMTIARPAAAALLAVALASVATAQPGYEPTPGPLAVSLAWYVEEDGVRKELKLTPEQVKRLTAARQKWWDFYYTASPKEYNAKIAAEDTAFEAAIKETLSPEQFARARQLSAQIQLSEGYGGWSGGDIPTVVRSEGIDLTRVNATTLFYAPELAAALKLTDDQKKIVSAAANGGDEYGSFVYLTSDQSAAAKSFLGPVVKQTWKSTEDPRLTDFYSGGYGPYGAAPGLLGLTEARDVRAEIRMTDEQVKELAPLNEKRTRPQGEELSPEKTIQGRNELRAEADKALARVLKPEQLARLKQISFQTQTRGFGSPFGQSPTDRSPFGDPEVEKNVGVTAEQKKAHEAAQKTYTDAVSRAVKSGQEYEAVDKAIKAAASERDKAVAAILTAGQTKQLADLRGAPFTGNTRSDRFGGGFPGGGGGGFGGDPRVLRELSFGRYTTELTQLSRNTSIQTELKLTPEQTGKASTAYRDQLQKFPARNLIPDPTNTETAAKQYEERSKFVEKALADILTADQAKRFRQIMLQAREQPLPGGFRSAVIQSAVSYPGVAESVKLTADQKKQLLDGNAVAEVLTAEQKTSIKDMLGEAFKGQFDTGGPGGGFGGGGDPRGGPINITTYREAFFNRYSGELFQLSQNASIQTELKLTDEQKKKASGAYQEQNQKFPGRDLSAALSGDAEKAIKLHEEQSKFIEKTLADILTAEQARRFRQIMLQSREQPPSAFGGGMPLTIPSAVAYPGVAESVKLTAEQRKKLIGGTPAADVLAAEQKAAIKDMLGEPFKGDFAVPGGFPGGGFVGGGGGSPTTRARRELAFGRYTTELTQLMVNASIQTELKLTPEQIQKVSAAYQDQLQKFPTRELNSAAVVTDTEKGGKLYEERSKFVEKALADILTADQAKRFRQVMLQEREQTNPFAASATVVRSAAAYPGVAASVKLTDEQRKKLIDGTAAADVLTAEQKAAIKDMLGDPFKGDFALGGKGGFPGGEFPGGGGGGFGGGSPRNNLTVRTRYVMALPWDALKLTPEQVTKLVTAITRFQVAALPTPAPGGPGGGPFGGGSFRDADPQKVAEAATALNKEVEAVLTADQLKRLDQLAVQGRAAGNLLATLNGPDAAALKLTPEQTKQFTAANQELSNVARLVQQAGLPYEQDNELRLALRDRLDERILGVLTAEQKAAWRALTGDPYAGFRKEPLTDTGFRGGRFGPGGF